MTKPIILIVEDDEIIAELLAFNLENEGYLTKRYSNGQRLFADLHTMDRVDLFILDIMLPGDSGFDICSQLRKQPQYADLPILMLTARSAESDKVRGLVTGADDYLTKPFGMRELMARVQALLRRYHRQLAQSEQQDDNKKDDHDHVDRKQLAAGDLELDDVRHRVFKKDREIEMTHREYELLKFLMLHRGIAYSRDDLLNQVWGYEYSGETRTVDVHIRQLRRKIEDDDANPVYIETIRGRGYRFADLASPSAQP